MDITTGPRVEDFQADYQTRDRNEARYDGLKHVDVCFCCGRGLTAKAVENGWMIHLVTDGTLATQNEVLDPQEDQGCFPVGSECAKKIPSNYKFRA